MAESALVISPHQDDETLGCGGTIIKKRRAGAEVAIAFVADGAGSHRRFVKPEQMREVRHAEAIEACHRLGVAADDVELLGHPSRRLSETIDESAEVVTRILDERRPRQLLLPCAGEMPPDHLAAYHVGLQAAHRYRGELDVFEYPVWFWQHWPWVHARYYSASSMVGRVRAGIAANARLLTTFNQGVFVGDVLSEKRHALAAHASQTQRPPEIPDWPILADVGDGDFLDCFFWDYEVFRRSGAHHLR